MSVRRALHRVVLVIVTVTSLGATTSSTAQGCDVAMRFLELEGRGEVAAANELLDVPDEVRPFLDRPGYVPGARTDNLSPDEELLLRSLAVLVSFDLSGCDQGFFGTVARVRISRPDFVGLFPNRAGGLALLLPATSSERQRALAVVAERFGSLSKVPMIIDEVSIPIVVSDGVAKVGVP